MSLVRTTAASAAAAAAAAIATISLSVSVSAAVAYHASYIQCSVVLHEVDMTQLTHINQACNLEE